MPRRYYLPFGESVNQLGGRATTPGYVAESVRQGFGGYEEDNETGLDYAQARYYANAMGRFTGVDTGPFVVADPQNLNRYSYVQNNPVKFTDPTGRELYLTGEGAEELKQYYEESTGYKLKIGKNGKVSIIGERNNKVGSSALAKKLNEVLDAKNAKGNPLGVSIVAGSNLAGSDKEGVFVDKLSDRAVDVQDLKDIKAGLAANKDFSDEERNGFVATLLGHVLEEYLTATKNGKDSADAHNAGLDFESKVLGNYTNKDKSPRISTERSGANPGESKIRFVYDSVVFDVVTKTSNKGTAQADRKVTSINRISRN